MNATILILVGISITVADVIVIGRISLFSHSRQLIACVLTITSAFSPTSNEQ